MAFVDDGSEVLMVLLLVPDLISKDWVTAHHLMHSSKSSEICCSHSRLDSQSSTNKSSPLVRQWVLSPPESPVLS